MTVKQLEWKKCYGVDLMQSVYSRAYIEDIHLFSINRRGKSLYRLTSTLENIKETSTDHRILQNKAQKMFESFIKSAVK